MKWNKDSVTIELRKQLPFLKENFGVQRIALFGSYVRGTQNKNSDIDLVIDYDRPMGFKYFELCDYLENIFERKVEVLTPGSIKSIRVKKVKSQIEKELTYV